MTVNGGIQQNYRLDKVGAVESLGDHDIQLYSVPVNAIKPNIGDTVHYSFTINNVKDNDTTQSDTEQQVPQLSCDTGLYQQIYQSSQI